MSTPDIQPPPGHEILTPEFLREHGAPEGMEWRNRHCDDHAFVPFPKGFDLTAILSTTDFVFRAPLGTMAMVSTPLPEVRCECDGLHSSGHQLDCPAHPRNARVKVLPGWLAELKEKPEGLMFFDGAIWDYAGVWPLPLLFNPPIFAYSLPRYVFDAIEEGKKEKKLPEEWSKELGMTVLDPDGWDRKNFEKDWLVPLTKAEFQGKAARSTARYDKYIPSRFAIEPPGAGPNCTCHAGDIDAHQHHETCPLAKPKYRPLAPDKVPQVGDDDLRCPRCLNPRQFADCTHPFHAGANPPLSQPAMCAFHYMDADKCPCAQARKDRAELEQLRAEKRARTLTIAQNPDDQEPKTCLVCGGPEPCSHKFDSTPVAGTPLTDAVAKAIGAMAMQLRDREMSPSRFGVEAQAELDKLGALESALAVANAETSRMNDAAQKYYNELVAISFTIQDGDLQACPECGWSDAFKRVANLRAERDALRNALEDIHAKAVKITKLRHFPGGDCGADSIAEGIIDIIDETKGGAK